MQLVTEKESGNYGPKLAQDCYDYYFYDDDSTEPMSTEECLSHLPWIPSRDHYQCKITLDYCRLKPSNKLESFSFLAKVSPVAKNNVTILSSTHCSAPSAWPLQSNIIGFSQFWRKLLIFRTRNIYKIERPFIKKYLRFWTNILWHLLHRLV